MNKRSWIFLCALVFFCGMALLALRCPQLKGEELKRAIAEVRAHKAVFLDVRESDELAEGVLKGALNFPISKFGGPEWERFVETLPKNKAIYTYCRGSACAAREAEDLRRRGFRALNAGGILTLQKAGAITVARK